MGPFQKFTRILPILAWVYVIAIVITLAAATMVPGKSSFVGDKGCYAYEFSNICVGFFGAGAVQAALNLAVWGTFGSVFLLSLALKAKYAEPQFYFYAVAFWLPTVYLIFRNLPRAFIKTLLILCACGAIATAIALNVQQ